MRIVDKARSGYIIIPVLKLEVMTPDEIDKEVNKYLKYNPKADIEVIFSEDNVLDTKDYRDDDVICRICGAIDKKPQKVHSKNRFSSYRCNPCATRQRTEESKERQKELSRLYQKENPERVRKYCKTWRDKNLETVRDTWRRWYQTERGKAVSTANTSKRRSEKLLRTPSWADKAKILMFYEEARRLTKETGKKWSVDHIIPLQGELVSGLHVHENLQVMLLSENLSKSNKFDIS